MQEVIKEGVFTFTVAKEVDEQLILKPDSTFKLRVYIGLGSLKYTTCSGKWNYISKDKILIRSTDKVEYYEEFMPGYISKRIRKIKIINENKIKMEPSFRMPSKKFIILKRSKY